MKNIIDKLLKGDLSILTQNIVVDINSTTIDLLKKNSHNSKEIEMMRDILHISNILYNNSDKNILPLEDGVYDILLELYKKYDSNYQVGAEPVNFNTNDVSESEITLKNPFKKVISKDKIDNMLFYEELNKTLPLTKDFFLNNPFIRTGYEYINKRVVNTEHSHPKLVGTLDKCKFVLCKQAENKGVLNDSNIKILERDFFAKHISMGILDPNRRITMVAELKYDGVSVEADITGNKIVSARTRGDANQNIAADLTPILFNYKLNSNTKTDGIDIGIKFEAIMTYNNLCRFNEVKGKDYKNCRTAISGLIGSSDAIMYTDYITLVPLASSLDDIDRILEIEMLNTFYHNGELLRYAILEGTYTDILFQIKRFTEEAEYMREYMPFMYDGIVVSYTDKDIIQALGRTNAVNKYSCAVKFNPLKKQTKFIGYEFTVGQDGKITPMIYYNPVEFYGTIHNKSTGHSYERFKDLNLRVGDIIDAEYVNDVMVYITKPDNSHNANNPNPLFEFITYCPSCGTLLTESESGKTMMCNNINCPERNLKRMVSLLDKLNIKDFSEASLFKIGKYSLTELLYIKKYEVEFLGEINSQKLMDRIDEIKTKEIYDYKIIGSLGFTGVAIEKWKLILNYLSIEEIIALYIKGMLKKSLVMIKGIGPLTAETINLEFGFFMEDVVTISNMKNVIRSKGLKPSGKSIRFTGFRDPHLMETLINMGHDASDKSVTKSTDILLVPYPGFTSSKTSKVGETTVIISVDEFKNNINSYLK